MRRREFITLLGGAAAAWPIAARATIRSYASHRRADAVRRRRAGGSGPHPALREGLEKLRWTIGRNLQIDYRWGIDDIEKAQAAVGELLARSPDVIMASTSHVLATLQQATHTVPIVFTSIYEPVAQGFVQSMAHPGGNITGFTSVEAGVGAKWLELLKKIAPTVTRIAFIFNPDNPGPVQTSHSAAAAASNFAVEMVMTPVQGSAEIEAVMTMLGHEPGGGLIVPPDGFLLAYRKLIIELAARFHLPAIYGYPGFTAEGGLVSYGFKPSDQFRQVAGYIDRILRGEKARDLPVQEPTKYELVINLKTAKALGLEIPQPMLLLADEVIE